ncbi:hypothetical protein IC235_13950 [Hymenobacter sp. BT664]|uniref:Uncharacterized protein n=2 Tax=Hymenobacter montanus TaxID=2771359 RepID=A0A927BEN1_9BACT|nr:hypothetical protein [Hymenobacter montanus]
MQNNRPKLIEVNHGNVKQIKTILHWLHKDGGEAHCLVRLYIWSDTSKALAVLSELRSNPPGLDITRDFIGVAKSVIQLLGTHIKFPIEKIVWVLHHGGFSYYETLNREAFTRVDLRGKAQSYESNLSDRHLLNGSEYQAIFDGIELEPIGKVMKELDWTLERRLSDGDISW